MNYKNITKLLTKILLIFKIIYNYIDIITDIFLIYEIKVMLAGEDY